MNKNIISLQYLRAYAAILVVLNHVWTGGYIAKSLGFHHIGGFGVDVFFITSGFIMCYTLASSFSNPFSIAKDFIVRRIIRIYPAYLIALIPFFLLYIFKQFKNHNEISFGVIIGNLLLSPGFIPNPDYKMFLAVAWTLVYEMFFYVIFSIAIVLSKNKTQAISRFSTVIIFMVILTNLFGLQGDRLGWVNLNYIIGDTLMLNFVMGAFCYFFYHTMQRMKFSGFMPPLLILILTTYASTLATAGVPRFFCFGLIAVLVVIITLMTEVKKPSKVLTLLGNASYSIYLTHLLCAIFSQKIQEKIDINQDIIGFLISTIAIFLGVLFYKLIEQPLTNVILKKYKSVFLKLS
jgi:exopolysaccharide production protein ExoZ